MLTEAQIECIKLLVKGVTITDIAEKLNISRSTIYVWKEIPEFKAELDKLEQEYLNAASNSLKYAAPVAAKKLIKLLNGKYEKTQLSAAIDLLDRTTGKATTKVEINGKDKDNNNVDDDILDKEINEVDNE
jgi:transcriptional regulator